MSSADKAPDAFRTISEVAEDLDLPQHVLRFWETRFSQIRPMKRGGGRRFYRPDDVDLLRGIKHLLYGEGYTIKGVQRILKSQGQRFVQQVWRDPGSLAAAAEAPAAPDEEDDFPPDLDGEVPWDEPDEAPSAPAVLPAPSPVPSPSPSSSPTLGRVPPQQQPAVDPAPPRLALRPADDEPARPGGGLSRDEARRLKVALYELIEARRLLDDSR